MNGAHFPRLNQRTQRAVLQDPNPPPPQTYLDHPHIIAHMGVVEKTPNSPEALYRRVLNSILKELFPTSEGFDVTQEETNVNTKPDSTIFQISSRPGGSLYAYEFCLVESKKHAQSWTATEDQLANHTFNSDNDSKQVYGIVHIGMEIKIYRSDRGTLTPLNQKMHLRRDVHTITQWAQHLKQNPLPFV